MKKNLKEQIKDLEGKWYWEDYKERIEFDGLKVIFDGCFVFELVYHNDEDIVVEEDYSVTFEGETFYFKKGEIIEGIGEYYTLNCDGEDFTYDMEEMLEDDGSNALKLIMLYIANRI